MQNSALKRVFIALNLTLDTKNEVTKLLDKLRERYKGIKWIKPEGLHLTLHFLGDLSDAQIEQVKLIMQSLEGKFKSLLFKTARINAFPNMTNPRVIFMECPQVNSQSVIKLQKLIGEKLIQAGFRIDLKMWQPHITLGRVKIMSGINFALAKLEQTDFAISTFELMESKLKPTGAEYKTIFSCKL